MQARTKIRTTVKDDEGNIIEQDEQWSEESVVDFHPMDLVGYDIRRVYIETEVIEVVIEGDVDATVEKYD